MTTLRNEALEVVNGDGLVSLPKCWEEAIADGLITRGLAEILVAPDPIGWRTLDTVPTPHEVRQRYRDHCERQNQKQEYRPSE